jgi:glutamyl-tRNA synthetase
LLVGAEGQALSKRDRSISIEGMREEGLEPLAVASYAATIGTSDPVAPHASLDELVARFDFGKLSRAPARFDVDELRGLNAKLLHMLPFEAVSARLAQMGVGGGEAFWLAIRGNLGTLADAKIWWQVVEGPLNPIIADATLCGEAAALLPPEPWDASTWERWADDIKRKTGAKGKTLFQPLRLAITGRAHGPELKVLLPLIGRRRVLARLEGKQA